MSRVPDDVSCASNDVPLACFELLHGSLYDHVIALKAKVLKESYGNKIFQGNAALLLEAAGLCVTASS